MIKVVQMQIGMYEGWYRSYCEECQGFTFGAGKVHRMSSFFKARATAVKAAKLHREFHDSARERATVRNHIAERRVELLASSTMYQTVYTV